MANHGLYKWYRNFAKVITLKKSSGNDVRDSSEIEILFSSLLNKMPNSVDGKTAILEMRDGGSPNWRQMEWIGFWFEYFLL